jgi:hypothetical protein
MPCRVCSGGDQFELFGDIFWLMIRRIFIVFLFVDGGKKGNYRTFGPEVFRASFGMPAAPPSDTFQADFPQLWI